MPYGDTGVLPAQKRSASRKTDVVGLHPILLANLVWLWFAFAIAMSLRLAFGMRKLRRLRACSSLVKDAFAKETQEKLCKRLGIRRHVALLTSDELSSPISLGLFSPAIILPSASLTTLSATELNAILAHELTHIKRWDYPVSLLQRMIGALMFFHPLYYLASRQLDKEREYITDAWVIKLTEQPLCYAKSLSHIAETTLSQPRFIGSLATVAYRGEVSKRVAMILHPQGLLRVSLSKKAAFVIFCLAGVLFAIASVITVAQNSGGDRMNILAANSTSDDQDSTPAAGAIRIPAEPEKRFGRGYPVDLAYSPDGKYLAIATSIGIEVYDADTYEQIHWLTEHPKPLYSISFSPDGKYLASIDIAGAIILRDTKKWKFVKSTNVVTRREARIQFSPNGEFLAVGVLETREGLVKNREIHLYQIPSLEYKKSLWVQGETNMHPTNLGFSPDGKILVVNGQVRGPISIHLLETDTGNWFKEFDVDTVSGDAPNNLLVDAAFSPDGKWFIRQVSVTEAEVWDAKGWILIQELFMPRISPFNSVPYRGPILKNLSFSSDSQWVACGGYVWHIPTWEIRKFGTKNNYTPPCFRPNTHQLAFVDFGWHRPCHIQIWDVEAQKFVHAFSHYTAPMYMVKPAFSKNSWVINQIEGYGGITNGELWRAIDGEELEVAPFSLRSELLPIPRTHLAILSRGSPVYTEGVSSIGVWNTRTEQMVRQLGTVKGSIHSIDVNADGKLLAIGESKYRVHVWEIETGRSILKLKNADTSPFEDLKAEWDEFWWDKTDNRHVSAVAFSPDAKLLAASGQDGKIRLWRLPSGKRIFTLARNEPFRYSRAHTESPSDSKMRVEQLRFDRKGKRLFAFRGGGGRIGVWDIQTGELLKTVELPIKQVMLPGVYRKGDFSSDSELFAWATPDGKINIYETKTFSLIRELNEHKGKVTSLSFSNDVNSKETVLASVSDDGTVCSWKLR